VTTSVVIVSYRPGDWLAPCVASVVDQADQVIVVDNGSPGETASAIARMGGADTVRLTNNRGFAGGFNVGLRRAHGDVIGVLNDDATADPGWLVAASTPLGDPAVAAVTPKVLLAGWWAEITIDDQGWSVPGDARRLGRRLISVRADGVDVLERVLGAGVHRLEGAGFGDVERPVRWRWTDGAAPFYVPIGPGGDATVTVNGDQVDVGVASRLINHAGSTLNRDGTASEFGLGAPDDGRLDRPAERFGFSGTAPVFRAETLRRIGSLANSFFAYSEDTDWCLRAQLAGMRIVYEPSAVVRHRMSATSGGATAPYWHWCAARPRSSPPRQYARSWICRLAIPSGVPFCVICPGPYRRASGCGGPGPCRRRRCGPAGPMSIRDGIPRPPTWRGSGPIDRPATSTPRLVPRPRERTARHHGAGPSSGARRLF
jgi:N-acetylglucosaminyl-diphospho-decaprenol L-rhamnosyltransferase